jgi:hypothetical protein
MHCVRTLKISGEKVTSLLMGLLLLFGRGWVADQSVASTAVFFTVASLRRLPERLG